MGFSIIRPDINIDFIGIKKGAFALSLVLILAGLASLVLKGGPRYGVDFAGGMVVQVKFDQPVDLGDLKSALAGTGLPGMTVQRLGLEGDNEYLVRTSASDVPSETVRATIGESLNALPGISHEVQRLEMVGPKVGADLRSKAVEALFYAVLLIAIYISWRFEQRLMAAALMAGGLAGGLYLLRTVGLETGWLILAAMLITLGLCYRLKLNFALGAVVALIHDVLITTGIFSILNKEFDLTIIAALLTIIGYSLNDTIIVFDRIRENAKGLRKAKLSFGEVINRSINQTLSRTILTSGTTLLVVMCLYLFGDGVIHDFALALLIGVGVGTYSSIFVASPILLGFGPMALPREEEGDKAEA